MSAHKAQTSQNTLRISESSSPRWLSDRVRPAVQLLAPPSPHSQVSPVADGGGACATDIRRSALSQLIKKTAKTADRAASPDRTETASHPPPMEAAIARGTLVLKGEPIEAAASEYVDFVGSAARQRRVQRWVPSISRCCTKEASQRCQGGGALRRRTRYVEANRF